MIVIFLAMWSHLPATDAVKYFQFSDSRSFFGIPNAMDVLSNLAFLLFGLVGLKKVFQSRSMYSRFFFYCGIILCASVILTCFGSMYFHWNPNPNTLPWDRLPMTVAFSTITAMVVADRVDEKIGKWALFLLIPLGLIAVIGFKQGWLTLKPYIVIQFGSIVFIALLTLIFEGKVLPNSLLWPGIGLYAFAKLFESSDGEIFSATGVVSGHTLKHLFAAFAVYRLLSFHKVKRETVSSKNLSPS